MADLNHSVTVTAAPEAVFGLISSGAGLTRWWAADVTVSADGESVDIGFFKRATVYRLRRVRHEPSRLIEWVCDTGQEWAGTRLTFELSPKPTGVLVLFSHAGWQAETAYFRDCNTTWGHLMFRLKKAAEGLSPGPLFTRDGLNP